MSEKKPYSPPQITQVELNHEQAVLSVCSILAENAKVGGGGRSCRVAGCKRDGESPDAVTGKTSGRDSAGRPS